VNARGTRGKITEELRHQWGLDGVFKELGVNRDDDHRKHAVDAVVVGVTENEHLRRLAKSKYAVTGGTFKPPWPDFREEVKERVKHINISHRVCRKVSGKLHEGTNYGPTKEENKYVFRKSLQNLTPAMVNDIVDPVVREIIKKRLIEKGVNPEKKGSANIPKDVWKEPLYMKTTKSSKKVLIKKVRLYNVAKNVIAMKDRSGNPYRFVEPGNNHHIEIFEYKDDKGRTKRDSRVVTMFKAVQRSHKGEPVVRRDYDDGKKFVCSLAINDMVLMKNKAGEMGLYRIQKMDANKMVRFRHHTASKIDRKETYIDKTAHLFEGYKVSVDPLGRISPSND
jgi:CRISPR-associated endonuclease Csn1